MKALCWSILLIGFLRCSGAETETIPLLMVGGESYTNARITSVTPSYVMISYESGITSVALSNMPAKYREQYHYSAEAAAQFVANQKESERIRLEQVRAERILAQQRAAQLAKIAQQARYEAWLQMQSSLALVQESKSQTQSVLDTMSGIELNHYPATPTSRKNQQAQFVSPRLDVNDAPIPTYENSTIGYRNTNLGLYGNASLNEKPSQGGMVIGGPLSGSVLPGSQGGMIIGGPLGGSVLPGSQGGMVIGGPNQSK